MKISNVLFIIPARGGSKGIPQKNIKKLNGIPLIHYSLGFARQFTSDGKICISTDDSKTLEVLKQKNYKANFIRPKKLATDQARTFDVILHALKHYNSKDFDFVCLLQPTSPFRKKKHFIDMYRKIQANPQLEMVVSVSKSKQNPYFNLFEESKNGFLKASKKSTATRRQDIPDVYQYNGSIYLINKSVFQKYKSFNEFKKVQKYEMPVQYSIDIDTPFDFKIAKAFLKVFNF